MGTEYFTSHRDGSYIPLDLRPDGWFCQRVKAVWIVTLDDAITEQIRLQTAATRSVKTIPNWADGDAISPDPPGGAGVSGLLFASEYPAALAAGKPVLLVGGRGAPLQRETRGS